MSKSVLLKLVAIACAASSVITSTAYADVYIDPDDYNCSEELKSPDFGRIQARVFAHKKRGIERVEGEWWSSSKSPLISVHWHGRDFGLGTLSVVYQGVVSDNRVRLEIGDCSGNQAICGISTHYATNFRANEGNVYAIAFWGAVTSIGRGRGDLYLQVQDEAGTALRENKIPVATLFSVEREMGRLMDVAEKRTAALKDKC